MNMRYCIITYWTIETKVLSYIMRDRGLIMKVREDCIRKGTRGS